MCEELSQSGVVAGFAIENTAHAVPLAKALHDGGITTIELMLRTDAGLDAVRAIAHDVPEILLGVGTILTPDQAQLVKEAGADFGVSPGLNPAVIQAAQQAKLPFAPGICTPSELEQAIALGCHLVKFFPAEPSGGLAYLKSMAAPYRHLNIQYFPLGGINENNMHAYLREPNVPTVGGSWIVKKELVEKEDWAAITARAKHVIERLKQGA
jgi:2-dehydro-3-deoxyphosphogluconate aldolase/(4S)-4-hydroxy-2-oxoglutarate aldolase